MNSFSNSINTLLTKNENYRTPNEKGKIVTDKNHPVHKAIVNDIPSYIKEELRRKSLENFEHIKFEGSTGNGNIGDSYWVALLDKRVTTSTTDGMYIVLLFEKTLEYVYLTIAFGTENNGLVEIRRMAKPRRKVFEQQIKKDSLLMGFSTNDIYLGENRAKKFAASACINKKYKTADLDLDKLTNDIIILNKLYYSYLYEHYMNEEDVPLNNSSDDQQKSLKNDKKKRKKRIIKSKEYDQLRLERDKRNKAIGNIAEEYIFKQEKLKLQKLGLTELSKKVDWISKREDGHGFDIVSYYPDGQIKYIEVKGSTLNQDDFTFYLSSNEKNVAEDLGDSYVLTLVHNVGTEKIDVYAEIINPTKIFNDLIPTNFLGIIKK